MTRQHDEHFEQLAQGYFDAVLNKAGHAELKSLLQEDDDRVKRFAELAQLQQMIESEIAYAKRAEQFDQDVQSDSSERLFAELVRMEQRAESYAIVLDDAKPAKTKSANHDALSAKDLATVAGYVLRKALTSKQAYYAYAAAVVLLVGMLFIPWGTSVDPAQAPLANQLTDGPDQPQVNIANITHVATLTAQHNAVWTGVPASAGPRIGDTLNPGTRLTLTAGFAEITTHRGAIAILEAPATIELLDNDNALHLKQGKLVGLCHTESSKGFLVKTDYADITDLGTEFGVKVLAGQVTTTVFTGEVVVNTPGGEPEHLTANQTARLTVNGSNRQMVVEDDLAKGFATLLSRPTNTDAAPPVTGAGVAVGQPDPNWQLVAIDGQALNQPQALSVQAFKFALPGSAARWIAFDVSPGTPFAQDKKSLTYTFRAEVAVPNPADFKVTPRFLADNSVKAIRLNGKPQTVESEGKINQFKSSGKTGTSEFADAFIAGTNIIEIDVSNFNTNANQDFVGLILDWQPITEPQNTP